MAGIAFAATAAVAGSPAEASRRSCLKEADAGKVVALSKSSVAYERGGKLHACVYSAAHPIVLPRQGALRMGGQAGTASIDPRRVRLAGTYIAYNWVWASNQVHAEIRQRVFVYDARDRDLKNRSDEHGEGSVAALFLKRNGSAAWTFAENHMYFPTITYVYKMDSTGDGEQELDRSSLRPGPPEAGDFDVDDRSLALSADGQRLYWERTTGEVRTAPIR